MKKDCLTRALIALILCSSSPLFSMVDVTRPLIVYTGKISSSEIDDCIAEVELTCTVEQAQASNPRMERIILVDPSTDSETLEINDEQVYNLSDYETVNILFINNHREIKQEEIKIKTSSGKLFKKKKM